MVSFVEYPTFMVFLAIFLGVIVTIALMPAFIKFLRSHLIGQPVRADGPESHLVKQGTPTMGGVIMLIAATIVVAILAEPVPETWLIMGAVLATGALGLFDDASKVAHERSLGLTPKAKLVGQFLIASAFVLAAVNWLGVAPTVEIPFVCTFDLGVFTTLLIGTFMVVIVVMAAIAFRAGLLDSAIVAAALAGCCIGFLWYNSYPADIFMGDTGSLALGTALGCLAIVSKTEILSIIIGGLFVVETLSVMIQVFYFKRTRKRLFLMAPLHHHFEKKGWSEVKVVIRFWIISAALAAVGFCLYFAQSLMG